MRRIDIAGKINNLWSTKIHVGITLFDHKIWKKQFASLSKTMLKTWASSLQQRSWIIKNREEDFAKTWCYKHRC